MGWTVLSWNIQGAAKGNVKLATVLETIELVKPEVIGFTEVGLNFPYDAFPAYTFQEHAIMDRNEDYTPKGLALGLRKERLTFQSQLTPVMSNIWTKDKIVKLTRPLLSVWVGGVEIILIHAPSSGGPLGRVTIANVYDYFRDQCRLSKGVYKGFAIGDFNAAFSPYMLDIEETYQEQDLLRRVNRKSSYYYAIKTCDPGWEKTQKSGGILDYMITCGVFGIADRKFYEDIRGKNESKYLPTWPSADKVSLPLDGSVKIIDKVAPENDSAYGLVKGQLDNGFRLVEGPRVDIAGWIIDHRPVIYDVTNADRGPLAPRVLETPIL